MAASTLRAGALALISYATDDGFNGYGDVLQFVVLAPIGSGTVIYFTDRNWVPRAGSSKLNDGSFAAGGGEGTFTLTVASDLAVGSVITISTTQLTDAGINLSDGGDTIYVYQGTDANTPTEFLFAAEIADGNTTFAGTLANTGLSVAQGTAIAVGHDNASFGGHPTGSPQHQLQEIMDTANNWLGSDTNDLAANAYDERAFITLNGPLTAPDMQLWGAMTGGGQADAIVRVDNDEASNIGTNLTRLLRDHPAFISMEDIAFDVEDGVWFAVMNEGTDITRIIKGNIADLANTGGTPTFTTVFEYNNDSANSNDDKFIQGIELDKAANRIFFTLGDIIAGHEFQSIDYNGGNFRNWGPIDLAQDNTVGFNGGIEDFVIDVANNTAYFTYVLVEVATPSIIHHNYIVKLTAALNAASPNPAVENYAILNLGMPADNNLDAGRLDPAQGSVRGIDIDTATGLVWFVTGRLNADGTGGIFRFDPANPSGTLTEVWQQPSNNDHNTPQAFPTTLLHDIEVDSIGGRYYITDQSSTDHAFDGTPATDENGGNIWSGALNSAPGTAPTLFADNFEPNGGAVKGMEINYAPTVTALTSAGAAVTEASSAPNSGTTAVVNVGGAPTIGDADTTVLQGAVVAITGFVPGDVLGFTNSGGITGSYNANTGVLTFTGTASYAAYQTVLDSVTFSTSGDNPTDYGGSTSRTITFQAFDGLAYSDPATVTVSVTGINDAPINVPGPAMNFAEDTTGDAGSAPPVNAVTGISVSDVDANPSTQDIVVTLSVAVGTLTIRTDVAGGLAPGEVTGNGTATLVLTGTQNQINKTLEAVNGSAQPNGLIYTPPANFNGATNLTITTNDNGFNGNDPGVSGTSGTEQDQDVKVINIADVNDAPTVIDTSVDSPTILEDTPFTNLNAPTAAALFGGSFSDSVDVQFHATNNPTGSTGDTFAGIAVIGNNSNANGQWQWWDGDSWENIGAASEDAARTYTAATLIRFNPALNFNGNAPTLTVRLIESGGPAIVNNGVVDLNPSPPTTGPGSVYTAGIFGTVTLSQAVTAVNDAPVNTVGSGLTVAEDSGATNVTGMSIADVDANPATDVFTVTLDVLNGTLTMSAAVAGGVTSVSGSGTNTVSVSGTINQINATLAAAGGLTYTPTGNYNGSDRVQITTNDGGATGQDPGLTGTPTTEQDQDSKAITVTAANDPVTGTAPTTATMDEDATNVAITGMSIADIDATLAPAGVYEVTLTATNGTMTLSTLTGLTFSTGDGTSDATMTFHGTLADINTALATASYTPTANYSGAATITLFVTDTFGAVVATGSGAATNDTDVVNVTVNAVNDAPVNNVPGTTQNVNEDGTLVFSSGNGNLLSVTDVDSALGDLSVTVTVLHGTLSLGGNAGLTSETGDGTSSITISGALAAINNALNGLSYAPSLNYNGPDTLTITTNDNGNSGTDPGLSGGAGDEQDQDVVNIAVASVNDAPTVAGDGTEEAAPIVEDTPSATGQTVNSLFSGQYSDAADGQFSLANPGGSSPGAFSGIAVVANGSTAATGQWQYFNSTTSAWTDIGTVSTGSALLIGEGRSIRFNPAPGFSGDAPTLTAHLIDNSLGFGITNGQTANLTGATGGTTAYSTGTVELSQTVTPGNEPPVVDLDANDSGGTSGNDFASSYTEGGAAAAISDTDVTITDADSGDDIVSATITITNAVTGDKLNVGSLPASVSVDGTSTDTVVKLVAASGTSAADFEAAIEAITFSSSSDNPTANGSNTSRSITVVVNDGDDDSLAATATIAVTDVNDAPTGTSSTITAIEDTFRLLAAGDLGFSDVDGTLASVTISAVTGGKIYVDADGTAGGGAPVQATLPVTFTAQDLIDGKASFKADPNLNGSGVATITFTVIDDDGASAASSNTLTVDVAAVNDSPDVSATSPVAATEQTAASILAGATVSDADLDAKNGGNGDYAGAVFSVSRDGGANVEDDFGLVNGANFTVDGINLKTTGGQIFGHISADSNGLFSISFTSLEAVATSALVDEVVQSIRYTNTSDNPPASVTLAASLNDGAPGGGQGTGAAALDTALVTVDIAAVNDAPVNSLGGTIGTGEDAVDAWLSGMSISDPDADPATDEVTVTFNVQNGTLDIRTDVAGGLVAASVTGDDTDTITVTGTLNAINATLAASNGLTYSPDANFNGNDTLTVTTNDGGASGSGGAKTDVDTRTISVSAVNDPAAAQDDDVSTPENVIGTGSLFANNSHGADSDLEGDSFQVTAVQGGSVGVPFALPSGAILTVNADGTYSYNPNGKFDWLTDNSSGAVNTSTVGDTFTYTITGGDTATVTVTVNGVAGPGDRLMGDGTDNTITGTPQVDTFIVSQGGNDTLSALAGGDIIYFGGALTADDNVTGGADVDTIVLQGDYSAGLTLDGSVTGIERISLLAGSNTAFGNPGTNLYDYVITTHDDNFAAGLQVRINGASLLAGEDFTFDGSAETDAKFVVYGGRGTDNLTGGDGHDIFFFAEGGRFAAGDVVNGGDGYDGLFLRGNYVIDFTQPAFAGALQNLENLTLSSASDERYARGGGSEFDYQITWEDGLLGAGLTMTINGALLQSEETMFFNGSDEADGKFRLFGGGGNDVLIGGAQGDVLLGAGRADTLTGGGGNDVFRYDSTNDSNSSERDGIQDFTLGDLIDLSRIDADTTQSGNQAFNFIGNAAFSNTAGQLRFENVAGPIWLIQGDTDGDNVSDFELIVVVSDANPITSSDFLL